MTVRSLTVENFKHGTIDSIEPRSIPRGAASKSLNWLTQGDHIELRRGYRYLGDSSKQEGEGKCTGLRKTTNVNGLEELWYTYGQKLKYFDTSTEEFVEVGTDLLGTDADGEDISLEEYVTNSGYQLWVCSPNCAGIFKVMVANKASKDMYDSTKNYKGRINIDTNSMFLWSRNDDKTGVYRSYIDAQNFSTVTAESLGTGNGSTKAFSGTLASIAAKRTVFGIVIQDSVETFTDNHDGTLTGDQGGTGTINYSTGAYEVTFNTAPVGSDPITGDYQYEDSTNNGIADFTKSSPRQAGQGAIFRQDEGGGDLQNILSFKNIYYCFHKVKTWALQLAIDDTPADTSNLPYREHVGIPNHRAAVETGDGIYYIDDTSGEDIKVRLLAYDTAGSDEVVPVPVSNNLNLNDYRFDQAAAFEWGDFVLFACRLSSSDKNDRVLVYNKVWKAWDILDYAVSVFEEYNGVLHGGDALSDNVMELFSGYDDDESEIPNYWEGNLDDFGIDGLTKTKRLRLAGLIDKEQKLKFSLSVNNGPFVEVGNSVDGNGDHVYAIEGGGDYVETSQAVTIGPLTLGRGEIGGGGSGESYYYEREFKLGLDKHDTVMLRVEAMGLGFASLSRASYRDIRFKGNKVPRKYRG